MMALMCLINIPACLVLGGTAMEALDDYQRQKKQGKNPVLRAKDICLDPRSLDYWQ